jgi:YHS domain-containing protein
MQNSRVKDPVCGMDVAVPDVAATSEYQGQRFYFCSKSCKEDFDREPAKYLGRAQPAHAHGCC